MLPKRQSNLDRPILMIARFQVLLFAGSPSGPGEKELTMRNTEKADRMALTVNEFCGALRIGRSLFYEEVKRGRIKILKAGRKTLIPITECEAYLRRLAEEAGQ